MIRWLVIGAFAVVAFVVLVLAVLLSYDGPALPPWTDKWDDGKKDQKKPK